MKHVNSGEPRHDDRRAPEFGFVALDRLFYECASVGIGDLSKLRPKCSRDVDGSRIAGADAKISSDAEGRAW